MHPLLETDLEEGEAEAIALAYEMGADLILLDERDARQAARQLGLRILGTVGILMWARKTGKIGSLREVLDALENNAKFRISRALRTRALSEAGEQK